MDALNTRSVPSLERALLLLEVLAKSANGLTLSQLARQLALPKSSLHCLLLTFERAGYLYREDQTGRFRFGLKLHGLANLAITGIPLRKIATPCLHALAQKTRMTTHMAILEQDEAVLVEKVEPLGMPRLATWVGKRMDLHCTALGKALIAELPDEDLDRLLQRQTLLRHNENTIVSPRKLKENLAHVRRLGYSLDDEEEEIGSRCIGAAVRGGDGRVQAAISIAGTVTQVDGERLAALAQDVRRTAEQIGHRLAAETAAAAAADGDAV
jgi:DNA-binding IclR family transcriptional regulator